MRARMPQSFAAGLALVATTLGAQPSAAAAPGDLPPEANLDQFYPGQNDLSDGWSLTEDDQANRQPASTAR